MSKRRNGGDGDSSAKRHQSRGMRNGVANNDSVNESLSKIVEQADQLISCLQILKNEFEQGSPSSHWASDDTSNRLATLSKSLLPSFESVASINEPGTVSPSQAAEQGQTESRSLYKVNIPSSIEVTPWIYEELKLEWPPLPQVLNRELMEEAFTHPGLGLKITYERLEWLGDAYLELIASALIHQTFNGMPSGRCSQLRERIIRNTTLAEYFRHYNMSRWAKLPNDFKDSRFLGRGSSKDKDLLKTQADMFEAYTAAIILSDPKSGLFTAVEWLKALWGRTLEEDIKRATAGKKAPVIQNGTPETKPMDGNAKQDLSVKIVVKGVHLNYKDLPCEKRDKHLNLPLFSVGLYLDGWGEKDKLLGTGTALSKKEAGQKAAMLAIQNKKMIKVYEDKKKAWLAARDAVMS